MERVEKLDTDLAKSDSPRRRKALDRAADVSRSNAWIIGFFVVQSALLVACGAIVFYTRKTEHLMRTQTTQAAALEDRTKQLAYEVEQLRQFVSSKTSQDVIYLKMTILKPDIDPKLGSEIAGLVHRYAEIYQQDSDLILAIMYIESRFDPNAVSNKGALGLMQVMPQWQKVLGMAGDLKDPETSIKYGLQVLGFYQEMYRDREMALTAYNRGPGPIDMALMNNKEFRNGYAAKIIDVHDRLKAMSVGK